MTTKPANRNSHDLINQVVSFYRQYLDCSPEQLDLLALWTMHTHIIPGAPFSPALNISSRQKHSGKTVCLQLLSLLCDGPRMHTAAAPSLLLHELTDDDEPFSGTLLLDDCDATFGKTRMNIKLQGLFTARFQQDARFTVRVKEGGEHVFDDRLVFFPAAFACNGRLHSCLAERSILIALEPKKTGSPCQPFRFYAALQQARSLHFDLSDWGNAHHEHFEKIASYKEDQFPPELSWRNRDCAEPLLHVADFIGGGWPQRARHALVNAFVLAAFEDFYNSKQILSDIRDAFFEKGNPEWISSSDVLDFLHTMDNRPWDTWTKDKPMQPKALARLLEPFGIGPRNHRTGPKTIPKGYYREDLEPVWTRHLPRKETCVTEACPRGDSRRACPEVQAEGTLACGEGSLSLDSSPVAANLQNSARIESKPAAIKRCEPKEAIGQKTAAVLPVAAELQNSSPSNPKLAANSQKPKSPTVAANLQNKASSPAIPSPQPCGTAPGSPDSFAGGGGAAPGCGADIQGSHVPVAAKLQSSSPSGPKLDALLRRQPKAASSQKLEANSVAADQQNSPRRHVQLEASSRKLAANVPLPGANWRADVRNTPASSHFVRTGKKEGIGQRIMRNIFQTDRPPF